MSIADRPMVPRGSLDRFVQAQDEVYDRVLSELRSGHKRGHWMWFVFPQLRGLGMSETSDYFGIADIGEARRYLAHDILRSRLCECCTALLATSGKTVGQILGSPDDAKLRSCMTLFEIAGSELACFGDVLERFFDGERDALTLDILTKD